MIWSRNGHAQKGEMDSMKPLSDAMGDETSAVASRRLYRHIRIMGLAAWVRRGS